MLQPSRILLNRRLTRPILWPAFGFAFSCALSFVPAMARAQQIDPGTLAAHDLHQGLLVAVDPYISAVRYKDKFGKRTPYDSGVLALDVFFRNDGNSPIRVNLGTIRLLIGEPGGARQKLEPLSPDDVADLVLLKPSKDPATARRFPIPGTGVKPSRDKNWEAFASVVRSAAMTSEIVAPHGTSHGLFYFDVNHHYDWLSNARLDVPDLSFMLDNKALFFFEIDLAPAAP
jgi:hypothetical protein